MKIKFGDIFYMAYADLFMNFTIIILLCATFSPSAPSQAHETKTEVREAPAGGLGVEGQSIDVHLNNNHIVVGGREIRDLGELESVASRFPDTTRIDVHLDKEEFKNACLKILARRYPIRLNIP